MAKKPTTTDKKAPAKKRAPAKRKAPAKKPASKKAAAAKKKPTRRGTPKGKAAIKQPHGGAIGQPAFVPTDQQREQVKNYARVFPVHGEHLIARLMGISRTTLRKYFGDDLELGRAQMLASVGGQMINRAMNAEARDGEGNLLAKGDMEAQKFVLARLGGWTTKVDVGEQASTPFGGRVDLSRLSEKDLQEYGRLAAIAEGLDPEEVVGDADD